MYFANNIFPFLLFYILCMNIGHLVIYRFIDFNIFLYNFYVRRMGRSIVPRVENLVC